jgi:hypothetical protein
MADFTMTNVLDSLPSRMRALFAEVIGARNPDLLAALVNHEEPTFAERVKVEDILANEFDHNLRENEEPTDRGIQVDELLGAFLIRWPIQAD